MVVTFSSSELFDVVVRDGGSRRDLVLLERQLLHDPQQGNGAQDQQVEHKVPPGQAQGQETQDENRGEGGQGGRGQRP